MKAYEGAKERNDREGRGKGETDEERNRIGRRGKEKEGENN